MGLRVRYKVGENKGKKEKKQELLPKLLEVACQQKERSCDIKAEKTCQEVLGSCKIGTV